MIYLTLMVSDLPVIPDVNKQKIYMRFEQQVVDEVLLMSADNVKAYFESVREVIEQDINELLARAQGVESGPNTEGT